eukprot:jgi/Tetstr1/464433/TSEL_000106.t1
MDTADLGMVSDAAAALLVLEGLHPSPAPTDPEYSPPEEPPDLRRVPPSWSGNADEVRRCGEDQRRVLRRAPRLSARLVDWWHWEHIKDLDVPSWRMWVNRSLARRCHSRTAAFLASGTVFALRKDDPAAREERAKTGEPMPVRPLGVGSVLTGFLGRIMPPSELDPFMEAVDAANISAAFSLLVGAPAAFYSAQSVVLPKLVRENGPALDPLYEALAPRPPYNKQQQQRQQQQQQQQRQGRQVGVAAAVGNAPPAPVSEDDVMGVGEDPVGEDGMDIDAPAWPPAGMEAADEGVIREGDPGDFYMKVIAKKFRGVWHYGVITGVVTEWVLEDYGGATQWRAVFEDGDTVDLLRSEAMTSPVNPKRRAGKGGGDAAGAGWTSDEEEEEEEAHLRAWESAAVPGSETNALTFAVMKCSAQVKSKNSNNSADSEWQLLHDIMPAGFTSGGMAVARSHKAMRKFLRVYPHAAVPEDTAARVWYVLSVVDIIEGWFRDPVWYACWKKGTDVSINAFRASSEAERLNEGGHGTGLAAGDFLHADNGIYTLTDDGFLSHLRATQSVTGVEIRCEDMPPHMLTSRSNWHPIALIGPPEPPNLGKIRLEVLHELAVLGEHGVTVTPADEGEQFVHKVFLGTWLALAGYAKDVIQRVDGVEYQAVRTSASCLLLSGDQMLEQMGVIGQIEEDLAKSDLDGDEDGELSPVARRAFNTTRLAEAKQNTGCHGVCQVPVVLGYVSMVNLFPLAPDHLCFLGLGKDFWRNFLDVLGHVGFRAMKQEDRRKALVLIPSNFGRGLRPSFAVSKKSKGSGKVTVLSGWVIEGCWHHSETFSLLTAGPLFEEARVKAIMTGKELASPANVVTEEDGPERKAQVDALTREGRTRYLADITVYARLAEGNGFVSLLVSNLHSAVCRMIHHMLACGHPLAELWMENLMGFLKAGAKRVLPKNVCETMMRDLLFAQQINRLKAHRLYREPNPNKKTTQAPAPYVETPIRLVGSASAAWEHAVDFKDHLEKLLDDVRRTVHGSHSYAPILAGWGAVLPGWSPSGGAGGLLAYKAASLRNGDKPRLHRGGEDGETSRDNSFFVYKMLKQVPDADPPPYTTEELESEEELPGNLLAEREDAKYTIMVARAQHFYLATPPPLPGADSDDSRGSARPIRAALCTVWTPGRAHTAVGLDLWRVPGGGGGSGGEEALVLLDGPGIRKVAVLMAPADMSSAKAADLGVDAGELLVAGIHARLQDAARAFSEASDTAARVASWNASLAWRNSALTAAVVGQGTAR